MIDISRALKINGWMAEAELIWLAEQAATHNCIVEIGSYCGRSTRAMGDHTKGHVFALDDFKGPRDMPVVDNPLGEFLANLQDLIPHRVVPVICDHRKIYDVLFMADMVFIDGAHDYKSVSWDIEFSRDLLDDWDLLCGHDITLPGVRQAVEELCPGYSVIPNTSIWKAEARWP